jgi:hypothetical protein
MHLDEEEQRLKDIAEHFRGLARLFLYADIKLQPAIKNGNDAES